MQRSKIGLLALVFTIILAGALTPSDVFAQEEGPQPTPSDNEVNAIAKEMYCPVCENIPLDVCGTDACAQWREQIREKLAEGWTEEEIRDYFVQLYGERVLSEPPRRGLNWLIYVLPPIAFIAGAYILYRGIKNWQKPIEETVEEASEAAPAEQDEYISRLEEELRNRQ
jgi:cytochrome c-type biogenesis protein CcmH